MRSALTESPRHCIVTCGRAQDQEKIHFGKEVKKYLMEQGVGVDENFPPCSPDLNLIQNVWGVMAERMSHYDIQSRAELLHAMQLEWNNLTAFEIQRLYGSWQDRLDAVIAAQGGPTKY